MGFETIRRRRESGFSVIEIERPESGSFTRERLSADLADACEEIAWDAEARAVVLTYAGEVFEALESPPDRFDSTPGSGSFAEHIAGLKVPVIAAVQGDVLGPALELALACDLRIGTVGARFGLPQVCSGSIPCDGGTQRLSRLIGPARALELLLLGETIDSSEALRIGLVQRVVEADALLVRASTLARKIASRAPVAVSYVKEALLKSQDLTLAQGLQLELDLYLLLFTTKDRTEGVTAFREKRVPTFEGE